MSDSKSYFIKAGYQHKEENTTIDEHRSDHYWSPEKAELSRYYQRQVYQYAASLVRKKGLKTVLDVGCGPGIKLMEIVRPEAEKVLGIDQSDVVAFASKRYGSEFFAADDFEQPSYESPIKYDLIICSDVIEHMKDPDILISYIKRFARPDSLVLFSTPERDILRGKKNMRALNKDHVREWNKDEFTSYLDHSGFQILETKLFQDMAFNASRLYFSQRLALIGRSKHCLAVLTKLK